MISKSIVIVGPTASGKTDLSLKLAKRLGSSVINTDSRLFYKNLDVGTGKPSKIQRDEIKHHLIDILGPTEDFSISGFIKKASKAISQIITDGKIPILVGGSGQYTKALIEGWDIPKVPPDLELRRSLQEIIDNNGVDFFYKKLEEDFPENTLNIDKKNPRRLIRAYELGKNNIVRAPKSKNPSSLFKLYGLTLDRKILYSRIDERIDRMIDEGWVEEVEKLIDKGCDPNSNSFASIGYKEIYSYIIGSTNLEESKSVIKKKTRNLVRHQYNWFRLNDPKITWFDTNSYSQDKIISKIDEDFNGN